MSLQRSSRRHMSEINIVPYLDVMLVLLLIFMIATPLMQQGLLIDLPETVSAPVEPEPYREPLVLEINQDMAFRLLREGMFSYEVDEADLPGLVAEMAQEGGDETLYVRADTSLPYGAVVAAIARLGQAGLKSLSLLTRPMSETP